MPIDINSLKPLSLTETEEIKKTHERIETMIREYAAYHPTEAHIFVSQSLRVINKGDRSQVQQVKEVLNLNTVRESASSVWMALVETKNRWSVVKEINDPLKVLGYVRSIAWRMHNKDGIAERSLLYNLDPFEEIQGQPSDDIDLIELWISVEQSILHNAKVKPGKRQDLIDLIRARIFSDLTRNLAAEKLKWDESKVQSVWKEIQRKRLLENLL